MLIVALASACFAWPVGGYSDPTALSGFTAVVVKLTNAERARRRIPALEADERLMRAAQIHAEQMARLGRLAHELPGARYPRAEDRLKAVKYSWSAWAENVASGQDDPKGVLQSWMKSTAHRENILNRSLRQVGVGYARDRRGRAYWVEIFGRPLS